MSTATHEAPTASFRLPGCIGRGPLARTPLCPGPGSPTSGAALAEPPSAPPAAPKKSAGADLASEHLDRSLLDLFNEVTRAMAKHPGRALMLLALLEEVGELCAEPSACLDKPGNREALHVATVALRIYHHGAPDTSTLMSDDNLDILSIMGSARVIGRMSHRCLHAHGIPD